MFPVEAALGRSLGRFLPGRLQLPKEPAPLRSRHPGRATVANSLRHFGDVWTRQEDSSDSKNLKRQLAQDKKATIRQSVV